MCRAQQILRGQVKVLAHFGELLIQLGQGARVHMTGHVNTPVKPNEVYEPDELTVVIDSIQVIRELLRVDLELKEATLLVVLLEEQHDLVNVFV